MLQVGRIWAASSSSFSCSGLGSLNLNTSFSSSGVGSLWAAALNSNRSSSSISGLGVLGFQDPEEEISSFNQGSSPSTIVCNWSPHNSFHIFCWFIGCYWIYPSRRSRSCLDKGVICEYLIKFLQLYQSVWNISIFLIGWIFYATNQKQKQNRIHPCFIFEL